MRENISMKQQDSEQLALKMLSNDLSDVRMVGQSIDRIFDKEGRLVKEIVGHNQVVNTFLNLVMCLMKQEGGYKGIQVLCSTTNTHCRCSYEISKVHICFSLQRQRGGAIFFL